MSAPEIKQNEDLSPEAVLARATNARGDIFPEWKPVAYASPKTYHLINQTVSYLHQYHGQAESSEKLSGPMRELIAIPALCAKGDRRQRKSTGSQSLADTPEWRYAAGIDPELVRCAAAFVDHCLLAEGAADEVLGPGPRELIAIAALCTRGEVELAAQHMRRAYDYGMNRRNVLEAICCVVPMTGMISAQLGLQAMQLAASAG